jgi:hypothetical protein
MNHREPMPAPVGAGRALHCAALLLLPALVATPAGAEYYVSVNSLTASRSSAYLAMIGVPTLRFQEFLPPPEPIPRPGPDRHRSAAAEPPADPVIAPEKKLIASAPPPSKPPAAPAPPGPGPRAASSGAPVPEPPPTTPTILLDEMRPNTRPEDFLPFFQLPGMKTQLGDSTNSVPAPAQLPPSSATYQQK